MQLDLEVKRLHKLKEHADKKSKKVALTQSKDEAKRVDLNRQIAELLAMIEAENKEYQAQIKQQKVYERTRDILNKNLVKEGDTAQTTFDLMKIQENTIKNLNNELNGLVTLVSVDIAHSRLRRATHLFCFFVCLFVCLFVCVFFFFQHPRRDSRQVPRVRVQAAPGYRGHERRPRPLRPGGAGRAAALLRGAGERQAGGTADC